MSSKFTQAQQDCLKRCYDDMTEHFEGVVIAVCAETAPGIDTSRLFHAGGFVRAVGLASLAHRDLLAEHGKLSDLQDHD